MLVNDSVYDPVTEAEVARTSTDGLRIADAFDAARELTRPTRHELHERGALGAYV